MAGIGNVFLGDDGFGVEVARAVVVGAAPGTACACSTRESGRGDLAYELVDGGYETAILVDAVARGGAPGTVYVIEPDA